MSVELSENFPVSLMPPKKPLQSMTPQELQVYAAQLANERVAQRNLIRQEEAKLAKLEADENAVKEEIEKRQNGSNWSWLQRK